MGATIGKGRGQYHDWTPDMVATLRSMASKGDSAGMIAKALGGVVTRSAVLGKANRLGIQLRGYQARSSLRHNIAARAATAPKVMKPRTERRGPVRMATAGMASVATSQPLPPDPIPPRDPIPLDQLKGEVCHVPFGDPRDDGFGFCGAPGHPWCAEHRAVVFTATKPRPVSAGPERKPTRWPSLGWGRGKGID